jgi:predicted NUDIX family NTP pyrophosphohydrolase
MNNSWNNNKNNYPQYKNYTNWNNKKKNYARYSAGILPYTYDLNGKCMFLLGKDNEGDWSDFGGRCEFKDNNDEKMTASREFYEETLGSVININDCVLKLDNAKKIISKTLNGSPYYMYIIYIDYSNYVETFHKTLHFMKYYLNNEKYHMSKVIEKNNIRWFSIDTLLNCIENKNDKLISLRNIFLKTIQFCKEDLVYLTR